MYKLDSLISPRKTHTRSRRAERSINLLPKAGISALLKTYQRILSLLQVHEAIKKEKKAANVPHSTYAFVKSSTCEYKYIKY